MAFAQTFDVRVCLINISAPQMSVFLNIRTLFVDESTYHCTTPTSEIDYPAGSWARDTWCDLRRTYCIWCSCRRINNLARHTNSRLEATITYS